MIRYIVKLWRKLMLDDSTQNATAATTSTGAAGTPAAQQPRSLPDILTAIDQARKTAADIAARRAALDAEEAGAAQVAQALFAEYQGALEVARTTAATIGDSIRNDLTAAKTWLENVL